MFSPETAKRPKQILLKHWYERERRKVPESWDEKLTLPGSTRSLLGFVTTCFLGRYRRRDPPCEAGFPRKPIQYI